MKTEPGYEPVAGVLQEALDQAQHGKGRQRHANNKPFMEQPIMEEARNSGPGFLSGQVRKKILEAKNCPDDERAIADLLGAIVYTVAMVLERRERQGAGKESITTLFDKYYVRTTLVTELDDDEKTLRQEAPGRTEYQEMTVQTADPVRGCAHASVHAQWVCAKCGALLELA